MAKARIKLPETANVGEVIEVKTLISHVMETGQRKDADGKTIPRSIINLFTATFAGAEVFTAELHPGISANPYLSFFMKVPGPGEFEFTWVEDGGAEVNRPSPTPVTARSVELSRPTVVDTRQISAVTFTAWESFYTA